MVKTYNLKANNVGGRLNPCPGTEVITCDRWRSRISRSPNYPISYPVPKRLATDWQVYLAFRLTQCDFLVVENSRWMLTIDHIAQPPCLHDLSHTFAYTILSLSTGPLALMISYPRIWTSSDGGQPSSAASNSHRNALFLTRSGPRHKVPMLFGMSQSDCDEEQAGTQRWFHPGAISKIGSGRIPACRYFLASR